MDTVTLLTFPSIRLEILKTDKSKQTQAKLRETYLKLLEQLSLAEQSTYILDLLSSISLEFFNEFRDHIWLTLNKDRNFTDIQMIMRAKQINFLTKDEIVYSKPLRLNDLKINSLLKKIPFIVITKLNEGTITELIEF